MHLLKAMFVGLIAAVFCLPSLAQTQPAANRPVDTAAPKKISATAKTAVAAPSIAAKHTSAPSPKLTQKTRPSTKKTKGKKVQEQAQLPPPPPPPPPTPAQLPPNPARVTMQNGLLTIDANNSTLADVLTGVRRETKAAIDLPTGASGERVVANLGPGTPQNVLTALLNGSRFDYIILGSQDQPDAVQRVILRAKSGPEPTPGTVTAAQRPNAGPANVQVPPPEEGDDQGAPAEEIQDENNTQPQQQEIDSEQQQGQPGQQQQQQQQPGVKTPEQLLEELRQMQQQQQQQQQQQEQPQQQGQPQPYQQQQQQPQQPQPSPDEQ